MWAPVCQSMPVEVRGELTGADVSLSTMRVLGMGHPQAGLVSHLGDPVISLREGLGVSSWRPCHFFETGSWCVIQAGLHLVVPLPLTAVITGVCHHTQQRECRLLRSIELSLPLDVLIGLSRPSAHTCPLDLTLSFSAHRRGLCCGVRVTQLPLGCLQFVGG